MTTDIYLPYQLSLDLKELGLDETCFFWYDKKNKRDAVRGVCSNTASSGKEFCTAPLWEQAERYLLKKWGINLTLIPILTTPGFFTIQIIGPFDKLKKCRPVLWDGKIYKDSPMYSYAQGRLYMFEKVIKIVKDIENKK